MLGGGGTPLNLRGANGGGGAGLVAGVGDASDVVEVVVVLLPLPDDIANEPMEIFKCQWNLTKKLPKIFNFDFGFTFFNFFKTLQWGNIFC